AQRPGAGRGAAFARGRAAPGQAPAALGPERKRLHRARRGRRDVHLPRRDVQREHRPPESGRYPGRQAPQRPDRYSYALLPQGTHPVLEPQPDRRRSRQLLAVGEEQGRGNMQQFNGFPPGKARTVAVPGQFFSELLPMIDDLAELKVTLYLFWALQQQEGEYRYLTLRELLKDTRFLSGLAPDPDEAAEAARAGLARAVERGTLLHVQIS